MKLKQKIYFTIGFLMVFFVAIVFFAILPLFSDIKNNSQELINAKNEIVSFDAEIDNSGIVKEQYLLSKENFDKIETLFVDSEVPISFIRFLQKTAKDSGVSAEIFAGSGEAGKPWPALYFQLSTKSNFLELARFLEKLENSTYLIEIKNLNIFISDNDKKINNVGANFLIKVFAKQFKI